MNKLRFLLIPASLLVVLLINSCSPDYPEGPDFSIHSVKSKIVNTWKWSYNYQNLENQTAEYINATMDITKDGKVNICYEDGSCITGFWKIPRGKLMINFIYPERDSAKELFIIYCGLNELTLKSDELRNTKDSAYVHWDLESAKKRIW
ncbi:MAG: hypothetical protein K1X92_02405 [Bacteroidia bacterium]|nr:hypothetical protein [Bacteroidia bacterium]